MEKERELQMMKNSELWHGETLCLKKNRIGNEKADFMGYSAFGVITNDHEPVTIYLRGVGSTDFAITSSYPTFEAAMEAGWVVD